MARWNEAVQAAECGRQIRALLASDDVGAGAVLQAASLSRGFQVQRLAHWLVNTVGPQTLSGPFRGMRIVPMQLGSLLMPRLLGTYESEIAHLFAALGRFDRVVDVGSAEGYYAVGCLVAAGHLRTIAFDTSAQAIACCQRAAELNGVADRLDLRGYCTSEELVSLADPRTLVVIDIDGAELDLLLACPPAGLAAAEMIVEAHRWRQSTTGEPIAAHLAATHTVTIYRQHAKDAGAFEVFRNESQHARLLATWEGRDNEVWLHLRPKPGGAGDAGPAA